MSVFGWRHAPHVDWKREMLQISDNGIIALDWLDTPAAKELKPEAPILVVCHGMNGGSRESYVKAIATFGLKNGWRPVVIISRGAAGTTLATPRPYNAGTFFGLIILLTVGITMDIRESLAHMAQLYPQAACKFAIGYSLGANALTRFCGEEGENCPLKAAVVVSNPLDLVASQDYLISTFVGRYYDKMMANGWCYFLCCSNHSKVLLDMLKSIKLPLLAIQPLILRKYSLASLWCSLIRLPQAKYLAMPQQKSTNNKYTISN